MPAASLHLGTSPERGGHRRVNARQIVQAACSSRTTRRLRIVLGRWCACADAGHIASFPMRTYPAPLAKSTRDGSCTDCMQDVATKASVHPSRQIGLKQAVDQTF